MNSIRKDIAQGSLLTAPKRYVLFLCGDLEKRRLNYMKAEEFDKRFDQGQNVLKYLDLANARRPKQKLKRVNVDFPVGIIH